MVGRVGLLGPVFLRARFEAFVPFLGVVALLGPVFLIGLIWAIFPEFVRFGLFWVFLIGFLRVFSRFLSISHLTAAPWR